MKTQTEGYVVWLTGLPGSGKTTISRILQTKLKSMGFKVESLDGDEVRVWLSPGEAFTREDREKHLSRVSHICQLLARNGVVVIASFVSPYRTSRDYARSIIPGFIEVFVKAPVELCVSRDPKGLYKRAKEGTVKNMTGVSDPYEEPLHPEIVVETSDCSPERSADEILAKLNALGYTP